MKPTKTNHQVSLWDFCRDALEKNISFSNKLGPYKEQQEGQVSRYFDCVNYDQCLGHAARNNWQSFICAGCRKVEGMTLVKG